MVIDGEEVSGLWVDMETGEICNVETHPLHQRNGHASELYRAAAAEIAIYHAPPAHRTPEGQAFAESVGGEALTECLYGCCNNTPDFDDDEEEGEIDYYGC